MFNRKSTRTPTIVFSTLTRPCGLQSPHPGLNRSLQSLNISKYYHAKPQFVLALPGYLQASSILAQRWF
jgi:hypothetical protein